MAKSSVEPHEIIENGEQLDTLDHEVGDKLIKKVDRSVWKVENRLVDLDHSTVVYRLRDVDSSFNDTEMFSASKVDEKFDEVDHD